MIDSKPIDNQALSRDPGFIYLMDGYAIRRQFQMSLCVIVLIALAIVAAGLNLRSDWRSHLGFAALSPPVMVHIAEPIVPASPS